MTSALTRAAEQFPAQHAFRHQLRDGGRESLAHMLMFPDLGIAGFVYPTVLADGSAKGRAALFGPGLDEPIQEQIDEQVPATLGFEDWRNGPLHMAVREPHRVVDIGWHGDRIVFDGRFEALHPPYAFSLHPKGNPPYYGDDRTEQHGRLTAELSVDGRKLDAGGYLVRDHSWGPRIWGLNQHYKWLHAITEDCSIHVFEMQSYGRVEVRGFLYRDGEMHHVERFEAEFTLDDRMMHRTLRARITDQAGRTATLTAQTFADIQLEFDPKIYLNEAALTLDIDGSPGTGWCEFCWNRDYYGFARQHVEQYG